MKRILFIIAAIVGSICVNAQTTVTNDSSIVRNDNTFTQVKKQKSATDTQTSFMYEIKDTVYPIWITKNGRCYIIRTSKKSGENYKQYLCEEVARQICKELNVEYKSK